MYIYIYKSLSSNNLKNIELKPMTKSGHKFKLEIKQYIPKQLSASRITQGWHK